MTFYDLLNDLIHYGKSDKRFIDCQDVNDYSNLEEIGLVQDFLKQKGVRDDRPNVKENDDGRD